MVSVKMNRFAFVLLAVFLLHAQSSSQQKSDVDVSMDKIKENVEICMKELKITNETLHKAYKDDDFGSSEPLKCFQKCVMTKDNKLNKDGIANLEAVKNYHKKSLEIVTKCNDIKNNNTCEYAYQLHKCMGALKKLV